MRALVIDDSRAMRAILRSLLYELGIHVTEAANGREALKVLETTGPLDFAMVDWNMPEMNGLDFVLSLRANKAFDGMRLIMCTTETEMSQITRAIEAGANEYVMKPFTRDVIVDKLTLVGLAAA
jgi:two-component system, chemotaxis family, chemotaxis protein CheY